MIDEETRDKTVDALDALDAEHEIMGKENSPSREALHFLKTYVKALFSQDTWVEARKAEYLDDLNIRYFRASSMSCCC